MKKKYYISMKRYQYLPIICLLTLFMIGCNDDFLVRTPSDEISSATFFKQEKDLVYGVNSIYKAFAGGFGGAMTNRMILENLTDNGLDAHSWNSGYQLATGSAATTDSYVSSTWSKCYTGIQRANRAIEGAEGIEDISSELKARLIGEAKFLRAFFYLDLTYLWGDVPFFQNSITPEEAVGVERTDKNIILDAMINDLDEVANDLPLSYSGSDVGRVTRGAALALKTRILLFQGKWTQAAAAAKSVMDLGIYSLYSNYAGLFDYEGTNCSEVIFDYQAMSNAGQSAGLGEGMLIFFLPQSGGGWSNSCPTQSVVNDYECTDGLTINESPLYDPENPYSNRDPRLTYSILYPGHEWMGGVYNTIPGAAYPGKTIIPGDDPTDGIGSQWNKSSTGYNWLKYISQDDMNNARFFDSGLHFILIRYADVLLMYAEAKIEADNIDQSVYDAINEVRARPSVGMPPIAGGKSQIEMREIVRRERRVEMAFEGLRLFDIRRWGIAHVVMPGKPAGLIYKDIETGEEKMISYTTRVFENPKHYLWPIPQSERDISGIEQNAGW